MRIVRKITVLSFITLLFAGSLVRANEKISLSEKWRIQPAIDSKTPPNEKEWSANTRGKGTNWANKNPGKIDSWWKEQSFTVSSKLTGKRLFLDFRRIEGDAIVFINGKRVGELLRPGGEIEITPFISFGKENILRVFITRAYTDISRKFKEDKLRFISRNHEWGAIPKERWRVGITAPVILIARPSPIGISDVFVKTSWRNKEITFDVDLDAKTKVENLQISAGIFDENNKQVLAFKGNDFSASQGHSTVKISSKWENPIPWELDAGYLYKAKVKLLHDGKEVDTTLPVKFGFREVWITGREMFMNGHKMRLRLLGWFGGGKKPALSFFRLMGYNAAYIQANPTLWWRDWAETPLIGEELLDAMDKAGFAVMLPSPGICYLGENLLKDGALKRDFERETDMWIRRYRNHPSVIAWTVGMNTYCPANNINPQEMGKRIKPGLVNQGKPKTITMACDIVKKFDTTRFTYSHADGSLGDISTSNMYLNFAPLQEREEWPMAWSKSGDMPYQMAEFGQPYTANFYKPIKGKSFLPTEYFAIYFGNKAYANETDIGLRKLIKYGILNKGHGTMVEWNEYPMYWDFQRLFVRNTNRAFRTWGINAGWAYWNLDTAYGDLPNISKKGGWRFSRYQNLKGEFKTKPSWANPNFDIHSQANKPLLAYIAGWPRHTDKTHLYWGGESVRKVIAVVWDGPGTANLEMEWFLKNSNGNIIVSGKSELKANPGETKLIPVSFNVPQVEKRTDYTLELKTKQNGLAKEGDAFSITVFPRQSEALKFQSKVAIWDPAGKSLEWIKKLGIDAVKWKPGDSFQGIKVFIIGREALKPGRAMPYSAEDIRNGLRVLILEQSPKVWQGLGFRTTEVMPRLVFPLDAQNPILKGLSSSDFSYWRGSPDLLPEGKNLPSETRHAPKWTNTNAVASSVLQIPRCVGFIPILACEFDMDYSPLLEWRDGKGVVLFCSLDLNERVGPAPVATLIAKRILKWLGNSKAVSTRRVIYQGAPSGLSLLKKLGIEPELNGGLDTPMNTLLIIGEGDHTISQVKLDSFIKSGGHVLVLPQSADKLKAMGMKTQPVSFQRCSQLPEQAEFRAIGANLLRWRDQLNENLFDLHGQPEGTDVLGDGLIARRTIGKGKIIFCQLAPSLLENRYANDKDKAEAVKLSVFRLEQLVARLLTNLGASPSTMISNRLCWLDLGPQVECLSYWNILGPYFVDRDDGKAMLAEKFPGEEMAIIGDTNPNPVFKRSDGVMLDWRPVIKADEKGFMNLGLHYKRDSLAVAYAVAMVHSDTDRDAILRVGCDWRMRVWVNGKEVFNTLKGMNKPAAYRIKVHLRKGENTISCKIGSGSKGFGFYADISKPISAGTEAMSDKLKNVSFYAGHKLSEEFDPYEFFYW